MAAIGDLSYRRRRIWRRIVFFFLLIVAIIMFFAGQADDHLLDRTQTASESAVAPVLTYLTMPVRGFENVLMDLRQRGRVHDENSTLKAELARLSDIEARANALEIKLSRFEAILNVDVASGIPEKKIAARAVSENNGPFVRSALLNAGAAKGIRRGYPVMTSDGLLGHIVRVGQNSSRVLKLEDLNSRVAIMSLRSQSRAILTGDNSVNPKLSFVTEGSDWKAGDIIVTSGDDGVLPPGLPIGYVRSDESIDLRANLYANENKVDWVLVYPYKVFAAPENDPVITTDVETDGSDDAPESKPQSQSQEVP